MVFSLFITIHLSLLFCFLIGWFAAAAGRRAALRCGFLLISLSSLSLSPLFYLFLCLSFTLSLSWFSYLLYLFLPHSTLPLTLSFTLYFFPSLSFFVSLPLLSSVSLSVPLLFLSFCPSFSFSGSLLSFISLPASISFFISFSLPFYLSNLFMTLSVTSSLSLSVSSSLSLLFNITGCQEKKL